MAERSSRRKRCSLALRLCALASASAFLCALLIAPAGAARGRQTQAAQTALEVATIDGINTLRTRHGLEPLAFSPGLFAAALLHDRQMVAGGYFGHDAPDGSDFAARVEGSYPPGQALFYAIGENLFWSQGPVSSAILVERWMQSAEHRRNLLNPDWRQVGLAVLTVPSAPGVFGGAGVTVVTVDFGVRR